ncbi:MAG: glycosyltransferase [Methylobacteriaceae bacterium]|nr:glycosyltransferase [Methylobacteriaceae bacterium]
MLQTGSLTGRTIALIHPAWHSCGTATVVASQARAYRDLGARVLSIGLSDQPIFGFAARQFTQAYLNATPELHADRRLLTGVAWGKALSPLRTGSIAWGFTHGDHAATYVAFAENSPPPAELATEHIDLVHCNHFFCMPLAEAIRGDRAIRLVLDTHDIQAKQYVLRNQGGWYLPPRASYEKMLATELHWLGRADLLLHLNSEEHTAFRALLPQSRHALLHPAVDSIPTQSGGGDFVIVASANTPNILSLEWLLREVMPQAGDIPLAIYGNVDASIRSRDPTLYGRFARYFRGRIDDIADAYAGAACVLLPTTEGHGLSIKTIEALSSGAPLIATRLAFRGIEIDPASLANVTIADTAEAFAAALRNLPAGQATPDGRQDSATRRLYEERFAPAAYREGLAGLVAPLLKSRTPARSA